MSDIEKGMDRLWKKIVKDCLCTDWTLDDANLFLDEVESCNETLDEGLIDRIVENVLARNGKCG